MDIKLQTGVKVSIIENEASKLLVFDRPIRTMELTDIESVKIGAALLRSKRSGVMGELRSLIDAGFFSKPRTLSDIKSYLFQKGIETKSSSLNTLLTKMVGRGELSRKGKRGSYVYLKPAPL